MGMEKMTLRAIQLKLAAVMLALAALLAGTAVQADDADPAILTANAGFYAALNRLFIGDVEPMKAVWSHAKDVSYMGPTGQFERGWTAVLKDWEGQAALKLGGKVDSSEVSVIANGDLAVISCYEVGENTNAAGKVEKVKLRATSIFRKEDGRWKMVGHQTDKLPYLAK
jgi:ketosteroid isomerase-like protein